MRNPNGYGGISFMGKNRRNPYRVRITTGWEYDKKTGRQKQTYATLGYYPSRRSAMIALAEYNKNPYDLDADNITFAEVFELWSKRELATKSKSRQGQLKAAYAKCAPLYNVKMKDLKKKPLQDLLDKYSDYSEGAQVHIKAVFKIVFTYCLENDIVHRDYSAFTKISHGGDDELKSIHSPFTAEEIDKLWNSMDVSVTLSPGRYDETIMQPADTVLMLIYTGLRPSELLNIRCENVNLEKRYMVGGSKTPAGKNRVIPLHDDILPLVEKRVNDGKEFLIPYKTDRAATYDQYRKYIFDPLMEKLRMDHLPHDGRHTFASFADRFELNKLTIKRIMGHASKDITDQVYTHKSAEELVKAVNEIVFWENKSSQKGHKLEDVEMA